MSYQEASASEHSGLSLHFCGEEGSPVVFVSGPPTGAQMFDQVQLRLAPRKTVSLGIHPSKGGFSVDEFARDLSTVCEDHGAQVLVAHGLALPMVLKALPSSIKLLIVSNGPTKKLDPVSSLLARLPRVLLEKVVLQPKLFRGWMASSVGFRRAVVNPYVMDKDTVATLSEPYLVSPERRKMAAQWIKMLPKLLPAEWPNDTKVAAVWGDADVLYPVGDLSLKEGEDRLFVSGGRFMHPKERPWELADACAKIIGKTGL